MRRGTNLLLALAALLLGAGITIIATDDGDGGKTRTIRIGPAVPAAVAVDGPDKDSAPDTALQLGPEAQQVAANATTTPERFDMAGDLRGRDPTPVAEDTGPLATPNFPGCTTRILPTNWSNRTSSVKAIGLHYTAGANRAGLADMNGLTAFASSSSAGVSWHFLIDAEGHCYYSVPLDHKAWTIAGLNSQTVNIEVIGTGREPSYPAASAGARKLAAVVRRIAAIYHLPLRLAATDGRCNVTRSGILTHWMGGPCSGGHIDIKPYAIERVVAAIAASGGCDERCKRVAYIRGKHQRTHRRFVKNECSRRGPKGHVRHGYCDTLRLRNARMHRASKAEHISLRGTYR